MALQAQPTNHGNKLELPHQNTALMSADRRLRRPNYFVVGVPKSGTSWLQEYFTSHPDIYVCPEKETHYFDRLYKKGEQWYLEQFREAKLETAIGEICHDYIYSPEALKRIYSDYPAAKIVVVLRDPVDRSVSHYHYSVRAGTIPPGLHISKAVEINPGILEKSKYNEHLDTLRATFTEKQILVLEYVELKNDPDSFAAKLSHFLGVEINEGAIPRRVVNGAATSRNVYVTKWVREIIRISRGTRFGSLLGRMKNGRARELFFSKNKKNTATSVDREWLKRQLDGADSSNT